jgi:6-pyruvoyl-tetrahydropterin synthase related domain
MYNRVMRISDDTQTHELPVWMRRARRGVDWGILLVMVMGLTVSTPFLFSSGLPRTNANENYVFRTANTAEAIQQGWLYPRWSPNILGGYGAPIPNFYPPLPAYAASLIHILLTNDPVVAVRFLYVIALCGGAAAVYALVMRRTGAPAGVIAAALYLYSPYLRLVAPHILGDLPAVITLALIPALLWATDRLLTSNHPQDVFLVSLSSAALCLTSVRGTMAGLIATVLIAFWYKRRYRRSSVRRLLASILPGLGVAAFYWIPALLEQSAIHWQNVTPAETFRLSLTALFSALKAIDPAEMVASPQFTIGSIGALCALVSAALCIMERKLSFGAVYLVMGVVTIVLAVTLFADEVWLTGVISLFVAVGSSQLLTLRKWLPAKRHRLMVPIFLVFIWLGSLAAWLAPAPAAPFGATDPAAQVQYEQSGYGLAVLPPGHPLPSSVPSVLPPNRFLIDSYNAGSINKLASDQINAALQASPLTHDSHSDRFQVRRISVPVTLKILTAYFPGWGATLAGQPIALHPDPDTGLIEIELPALGSGSNELVITLGGTDVRRGAWIITLAALSITVVITWGRYRRRSSPFEDQKLLNQPETRLIALPILSFLLVAVATSAVVFPFSPYVRPGISLDNSFITQTRTDAGLTLTGFQMRSNIYRPGDTVDLTLYWQAQRFLSENYQIRVALVNNQDASRWNEQPLRHPGYYPTRRWNTRQYVSDRYHLRLRENIVPGNYQIQITIDDCDAIAACPNSTELTFFGSGGQNIGTTFTLPTLITVRP